MKLANRLQMIDGIISMKDGSDLQTYLKSVQDTWGCGKIDISIQEHGYAQKVQDATRYGWAA